MAESQSLKDVIKSIQKNFGADVIQFGVKEVSERGILSLGTPTLDFCVYNSIPQGCFIEISGKESSGKTTLAFLIARSYMRNELKDHPDNPRAILFIDAEGTADPSWAKQSTGYDMNDNKIKTLYLAPQGQSMEEILDMCIDAVKTGEVGLVILDSLVALAPQLTNEESLTKKDMGGIAKPMADFVKRSTGVFNKHKCTFIGLNGVIMNIGGYGNPEVTPGGEYWKRACSLRIRVKRGDYFDAEGNTLKTSATNPAGHTIEMALLKSKFCRSDRKLGIAHLNYSSGMDILQDTIDTAIILGLIDNSTQGYYKIIDVDTGEIATDSEGNEIKIKGIKNVKPYFLEHPEEWHKLYDKVYDRLSDKTPSTIQSFEQMLGIDMDSYFGVNISAEQAE